MSSPEAQKYLKKYKEFVEVKNKKDEFVEELERGNKERWDKYTKGVDSPSKKGQELKEVLVPPPTRKCNFSTYSAVIGEPSSLQTAGVTMKVSPLSPELERKDVAKQEEEAILKALRDKDREAFLALRQLYNALDTVFPDPEISS